MLYPQKTVHYFGETLSVPVQTQWLATDQNHHIFAFATQPVIQLCFGVECWTECFFDAANPIKHPLALGIAVGTLTYSPLPNLAVMEGESLRPITT